MQPQDPNNQNTTPATPPPIPPAPVPGPPTADPAPIKPEPSAKKIPNKALIGGILGAIVVVVVGVCAYFLFFSGIKLATYSGQSFSIQYPDGYEQKDAGEGSATFTEKGDAATASEIGAYYAKFAEPVEQEQIDLYKNALKEQLQSKLNEVTGADIQTKDAKVENIKYKGQDAFQLTAKTTKNGKEDGSVKLIAVFDTEKFYMILVKAHTTDPGVAAAADKIINSFTIKQQ